MMSTELLKWRPQMPLDLGHRRKLHKKIIAIKNGGIFPNAPSTLSE